MCIDLCRLHVCMHVNIAYVCIFAYMGLMYELNEKGKIAKKWHKQKITTKIL